MDTDNSNMYFIELTRIGNTVKAVACDPDTHMEVSIIAPANAPDQYIKQLVVQKLRYMLQKAGNKS